MKDFSYYLPVHIQFGWNASDRIGELTASWGNRALIVTGNGGSARRSGVLERVRTALQSKKIIYEIYDDVMSNPGFQEVKAGAAAAKAMQAQFVIAVGGGSVIDCAKGIAFAACNEGFLGDYIKGRKRGINALPIAAIPTTCGTGSECTPFAVLTDEETHDKRALSTRNILPSLAVIDPSTMTSMPMQVLAAVAFDALCHHMEAYLSSACSPMTEMQSLYGMRLFSRCAQQISSGMTSEAWEGLALCSTLGGMSISLSGVTAPHGLEHPLSGLRNVTHGRGLAILTLPIFARSIEAAPKRFAAISRALGGADEQDLIDILQEIIAAVGLSSTLSQEGVQAEDIPWLVKNAMRSSRGAIMSHPKIFSKEEIRDIYETCM